MFFQHYVVALGLCVCGQKGCAMRCWSGFGISAMAAVFTGVRGKTLDIETQQATIAVVQELWKVGRIRKLLPKCDEDDVGGYWEGLNGICFPEAPNPVQALPSTSALHSQAASTPLSPSTSDPRCSAHACPSSPMQGRNWSAEGQANRLCPYSSVLGSFSSHLL